MRPPEPLPNSVQAQSSLPGNQLRQAAEVEEVPEDRALLSTKDTPSSTPDPNSTLIDTLIEEYFDVVIRVPENVTYKPPDKTRPDEESADEAHAGEQPPSDHEPVVARLRLKS